MAKVYKIWIEIEEIDEENDSYINLDEEIKSVGEFETLAEARAEQDLIIESARACL